MLHQDGSRHAWLAVGPALDLIVTMDDATGSIHSEFPTKEEGTASTFRGLSESFGAQGLTLSLYADRAATIFIRKWDGRWRIWASNTSRPIRRRRADARSGSSRRFRTACPRNWRWRRSVTMEAANVLLRDVYLPAHNARFAVEAEQDGTAFVAISGVDLDEILCVQEDRKVGNDNTVSYNRLKLQIPASPLRAHFVEANVEVRQYHDGTCAIFHGPRSLGRYDTKAVIEEERKRLPKNKQKGPPESARRSANENLGQAHASTSLSKDNKTRRSGHVMCHQNRPS